MTVTGVRRSWETFATNSPRARSSATRRSAIRSTSAPRRPDLVAGTVASASRQVAAGDATGDACHPPESPGVRRSRPEGAAHGADQHRRERDREADPLAALDRTAAGTGNDEQATVADRADCERHPAAPVVAAPARIGGTGPVGSRRDIDEDRPARPLQDRDPGRCGRTARPEHGQREVGPVADGACMRCVSEVVDGQHDECPERRRDRHRQHGDRHDEAVREHAPHHDAEPTRA